ncbi:MAG: rhomboid family intramembrane serine protease [Prevotella sp.]|nr:rhomboid family intramembrane serine protease [Alistipes senegalensis]MCM1358384.1 rhomboid family intramembrane serine protease [Prevotella sp.]MCM1474613.1 rhomboid family intramembrane serine protease [Muribaculaceae bacterium]MDE6426921.1 rhomboid family intramembrane serine protease [Ruminococcus sp.]
MGKNKSGLKISFNSPVILGFTAICLIALILSNITHGASNNLVFSVYHSSMLSPLTYIRFFGHVFGHASWEHFMGNMTYILLLGPLLEEKYGRTDIIMIIAVTALVTGIINFIFFPHVQLLGASGVVFAFILLSSFTGFQNGKIPLTFILVAVIYIGQQIYDGIFTNNNISELTHIIGGLIGSAFGFVENKFKR